VRRRLAFSLLVALQAPVVAQPDPFAALRFLLGDWRAVDTPPGEAGAFAFSTQALIVTARWRSPMPRR